MRILTTNSAGNDRFGGIQTRKLEHIRHSPEHRFHVVELNHEKSYRSKGNLIVHRVDTRGSLEGRTVFDILNHAQNHQDFDKGVERLVGEYQNAIQDSEPDVILIPGTSLTSYMLFKAARRERVLDRTIQEYAGILEKEIGNYTGDPRYILKQIGKVFVSPQALEDVTYMFPSRTCKEAVEEIHEVKIPRSHIVWNGLSQEFEDVGERNVPEDLTFGYVGRVHHVKNLPFFLNLGENLGEEVRLKVITDINSAWGKPTGKPLAAKMTSGEVQFHHPRDRSELAEFYATQLSASVVPSFFETYCNGAIESVVSGTPVLLSDRAGAKEVLEKHGLEKLVFSTEDMDSFRAALEHARAMDFRIPKEKAEKIYDELNWGRVIKRYNEIAERVAARAA